QVEENGEIDKGQEEENGETDGGQVEENIENEYEDGMADSNDFLSAYEGPYLRFDLSDAFEEFYASADEDWDSNAS
ncbi:hypothetical protein A2U01_0099086, partial [Trifolium medium]|nr:hypothetical protein [Trifolium medium]